MIPDLENDRLIGQVRVGRGTYWSATTRFQTYHPGEEIIVGRYCSIAPDVIIHVGGDHQMLLPSTWPFDVFIYGRDNPSRSYKGSQSTVIGSDVWLGTGAFIGSGRTLGHGCVVAARAVVVHDVPPYAVVAGNPARIVKHRFDDNTVRAMLDIAWWNWEPQLIRERAEWFYRPIAEFILEFGFGER